ncbi:MAG: hypothetical protein ACOZAK_00925 [Patescibacteria group bacterium]
MKHQLKVVGILFLTLAVFLSACAPSAGVAPAAPATGNVESSPVLPDGSVGQPAGVYVYADLKPYFADPMVSACIEAIAYTSMTYEERGAYCVPRYLKPKAQTMTAAELSQSMGLATVYAIRQNAWQIATPESVALPSLSWLGPTLIGLGYALGVGTTYAYIATSETYAAKVASWEMEALTPETQVIVLGYEGVITTSYPMTGEIPSITSWEQANAEWDKLYATASTIPLTATANIGMDQKTFKGPAGSTFTLTYIGLSSMCYMNLFTHLMWWDGNQWQHKMFESNINRSDGPCKPWDFVDIFRQLADKISEFAKKLTTEQWFSSNAYKVIEDLMYFAFKMITTILKGMVP